MVFRLESDISKIGINRIIKKKDNFKQHFVGKNRLRKISASSCCKN